MEITMKCLQKGIFNLTQKEADYVTDKAFEFIEDYVIAHAEGLIQAYHKDNLTDEEIIDNFDFLMFTLWEEYLNIFTPEDIKQYSLEDFTESSLYLDIDSGWYNDILKEHLDLDFKEGKPLFDDVELTGESEYEKLFSSENSLFS